MMNRARRRRMLMTHRQAFVEDPENDLRKRQSEQQMRLFDRLPDRCRSRIANNVHDTDVVELIPSIERRGPSSAVRAIFKERGVMACDVPPDEWIDLELQQL